MDENLKPYNTPTKCRKCETIVDQSEIVKLGIREEVQSPDGGIAITSRMIVDLCKDCYREIRVASVSSGAVSDTGEWRRRWCGGR